MRYNYKSYADSILNGKILFAKHRDQRTNEEYFPLGSTVMVDRELNDPDKIFGKWEVLYWNWKPMKDLNNRVVMVRSQ